MRQPCLDCGTPAEHTRCETCGRKHRAQRDSNQTAARRFKGGRPQYGNAYRKAAAQLRATATTCWICKGGPKRNDPFQADHGIPVSKGGGVGPLAPAHRSCNIARSNKLRATNPTDIAPTQPHTTSRGGRPPHQRQQTSTAPPTDRTDQS